MAALGLAAAVEDVPLWAMLGGTGHVPLPEIQIIGGGAHAVGTLDLQDLMVVAPGARSFTESSVAERKPEPLHDGKNKPSTG